MSPKSTKPAVASSVVQLIVADVSVVATCTLPMTGGVVSTIPLKVAVAATLASITIVTGLVIPVRSPPQPSNTHPASGVAVSVTCSPGW